MPSYDQRFQDAVNRRQSTTDARQKFLDMMWQRMEQEEAARQSEENDRSIGGALLAAGSGALTGAMAGGIPGAFIGAGVGAGAYALSPKHGGEITSTLGGAAGVAYGQYQRDQAMKSQARQPGGLGTTSTSDLLRSTSVRAPSLYNPRVMLGTKYTDPDAPMYGATGYDPYSNSGY